MYSQSFTADEQTLVVDCPRPNNGGAGLQLEGTFTASVKLEGTVDGVNWVAIQCELYTAAGTFQSTFAAPMIGWINIVGLRKIRWRVDAYTSGTINATISIQEG